jgi:outer membrane lipoprotein-sorting protein
MGQVRRFSRRLRLRRAIPAAVVGVAGAVLAGTVLASAAPPALPHRTPAQLLAGLRKATVPPAMSAVLSESANLGIPALPDLPGMSSSAMSPAALLAGSHTIEVWYAGPRYVRIALPVSFGETDLRVNGNHVWLWDSQGQKATRYALPALPGPDRTAIREAPGERAPAPAKDPFAGMTPLQAARQVLAMVGKTTKVTVPGTVEVAGRPAYQLAIAPRSGQSLIGRVLIAIDASTRLPLDVQVFARGASSPAFHIGFTSISFARPAMSNFVFTPPPGAQVKTVRPPASLPGWMSGAGTATHRPSLASPDGSTMQPRGQGYSSVGAQTFGSGWLTVVVIPAAHPPTGIGSTDGKGSAAYHSTLTIKGLHRQVGPLLQLLLKAATPVHGAWGSGRLLRTSLLSVLITSKGQVLIGAVTPAVLYADAAKVK